MFREMLRKNRQISREACIEILKAEPRGVLSVLGDDGYPYGLPINHFYDETDSHIYFHTGRRGHKIDALARHDRASLCVYDQGYREEGDWALHIRSVVVFGRVRPVEDQAKAIEISRRLSNKFTDDEAYIEDEIRRSGAKLLCLEMIPEHICGKLVHEK